MSGYNLAAHIRDDGQVQIDATCPATLHDNLPPLADTFGETIGGGGAPRPPRRPAAFLSTWLPWF